MTLQLGSIRFEKKSVRSPFRYGTWLAYLTIRSWSSLAQASLVSFDFAWSGGRCESRSISLLTAGTLTFELLLLCVSVIFVPSWRTPNQSVGYG